MLTVGPRYQFPRWRHSRRRLSVCSVWGVQIHITVQSEFIIQCRVSFVHGLKKDIILLSFLNHEWSSCCTVITDLDTSKWSIRKAFSCWQHMRNLDSSCCWKLCWAHVGWVIHFLSTFEPAQFFCVCPVMHKPKAVTYSFVLITMKCLHLKITYIFMQYFPTDIILKNLTVTQLIKNSSHLMEHVRSLLCSWELYYLTLP
jgi:hypothetical protein